MLIGSGLNSNVGSIAFDNCGVVSCLGRGLMEGTDGTDADGKADANSLASGALDFPIGFFGSVTIGETLPELFSSSNCGDSDSVNGNGSVAIASLKNTDCSTVGVVVGSDLVLNSADGEASSMNGSGRNVGKILDVDRAASGVCVGLS